MGRLLRLVQRGADWAGPRRSPLRPLLAVPNVTAQCPAIGPASVRITVLLYNGQLRYGFNVPTKG